MSTPTTPVGSAIGNSRNLLGAVAVCAALLVAGGQITASYKGLLRPRAGRVYRSTQAGRPSFAGTCSNSVHGRHGKTAINVHSSRSLAR
jgi:hypothetical protein